MSHITPGIGRRRFLRWAGVGLATVAAAPALSSCAGPGTDESTMRLGAMFPVTGTTALLGEESWRGVRIAPDMRSREAGIAGKQIQLDFADVPDVAAAASGARRLVVNKSTNLGLGAYGSSLALAAWEVSARTG